jgi:hypothetical protein
MASLDKLLEAGVALVAAVGAVIAFLVVAFALDRGDLRSMTRQVVSRLVRSGAKRSPSGG